MNTRRIHLLLFPPLQMHPLSKLLALQLHGLELRHQPRKIHWRTRSRAVKEWKKKNNKSEAIIELMVQGLEIKEAELQQKKKDRETLIRAEEREQRLVDCVELLVKHMVKE
jgi:hypothetical protein